jgi:kinesin family protein 6/9
LSLRFSGLTSLLLGVRRLDPSRGGDSSTPSAGKRPQGASSGGVVPDKAEAFEEFKTQDGAEVNRQLKENVTALKDKKVAQKDLATRINAVKSEIDAIQSQVSVLARCWLSECSDALKQLDTKRRDADADASGLVDEEEFAIVKSMKEKKKIYRDSFEELKQIKSEVEYLNRLVDQCRSKLVQCNPFPAVFQFFSTHFVVGS